jgi:hypothetical protein
MGSSRPRNSTRAGKAQSHSISPSPAPGFSPDSNKLRPVEEPAAHHRIQSSNVVAAPGRGTTDCGALRQIRAGLEVAKSAAYVSSIALSAQAADADPEVALVLRRTVADEISRQVERIDGLLQ